MPKSKPSRGVPLVPPQRVLDRYHRVSGETSFFAGQKIASVEWGVSGYYMDEAVVAVTSVAGMTSKTPVGRYNPATRKWGFAPEYVMRDEVPALQRAMHGRGEALTAQMNARSVDAERTVVDVYHPYTHKIRAELAKITQGLGNFLGRPAVRAAMAEPNSSVFGVDRSTFFYPTMGTDIYSGEVVVDEVADGTISAPALTIHPHNRLSLTALDVRVQNPTQRPGTTVRDSRPVVVARRSHEDHAIWVPNVDIVDPDRDWPVVTRIIDAMEAARTQNPNFSLLHCAVTYGNEYALATARVGDM